MRAASVELSTHIASNATTVAVCWKVTRVDEQVFGFTSHDEDLPIDGVTYVATQGIGRSTLEAATKLQAANLEVIGFLDSAAITADDLNAGVWDHAEVRIFEVNWADLTMGVLRQMRGWLGEVSIEGGGYKAELRGLADALNKNVGEIVGPACTATLGDARCKMVLADYTATGEVTAVVDARREFDSDLASAVVRLTPGSTGAPPDDYFATGLLTWDTGANAGRRMEVKTNAADGRVVLQLAMVSDIAPGDTFTVVAGCMKSREVCVAKFGNVVNMRGFPDLPGIDKVMRVGGQ